MAEETKIEPDESQETMEEMPEEEESPEETGAGFISLTSPEGVFMLLIAGVLDFLSIVCAILTFFGIGLLLSKIVYVISLISISGWSLFRSGAISSKKKKGSKLTEVAKEKLGKLFKKHGKKLGAKLIPIIGDLIPYWTIIVYEELINS